MCAKKENARNDLSRTEGFPRAWNFSDKNQGTLRQSLLFDLWIKQKVYCVCHFLWALRRILCNVSPCFMWQDKHGIILVVGNTFFSACTGPPFLCASCSVLYSYSLPLGEQVRQVEPWRTQVTYLASEANDMQDSRDIVFGNRCPFSC